MKNYLSDYGRHAGQIFQEINYIEHYWPMISLAMKILITPWEKVTAIFITVRVFFKTVTLFLVYALLKYIVIQFKALNCLVLLWHCVVVLR